MQPQVNTRAAGPGAIDDTQLDVRPMLEGASEYEYVEIYNPLSVDFVAKFAITRPTNSEIRIVRNPNTPTVTESETDIRRNYGLDLRNKDHQGKANIINKVTIPAGKTIRVLGNEAQVIVNQLVTEILQREEKKLHLADPTQRNIVEQRLIRRRDSVESLMGRGIASAHDQLQQAIQQPQVEVEFPDAVIKDSHEEVNAPSVSAGSNESGSESGESDSVAKRGPGRPPKAASTATI